MAKAVREFINDSGELVPIGAEVWAAPERLLVLRRLGLVDDTPALPPWQRPAVIAAAAAPPRPDPIITPLKPIVPSRTSKPTGRAGNGRRLVLSMM